MALDLKSMMESVKYNQRDGMFGASPVQNEGGEENGNKNILSKLLAKINPSAMASVNSAGAGMGTGAGAGMTIPPVV